MKKNKKMLKVSFLGMMMSIFLMSGVSATTVAFPGQNVPSQQTYAYVDAANKSASSNKGIVKLTRMEVTAVTFSARAVATGHSYGSGKIVTQENTDFNVPYTATYGSGQKMQARFRNHNWTLNSTKIISGTFDYK